MGLAFVASGLVGRVRRPENRTGLLMIFVGLTWFGGALQASNASLPYTIGYAGGTLIAAILIHLVLAFPSGRLLDPGRATRDSGDVRGCAGAAAGVDAVR